MFPESEGGFTIPYKGAEQYCEVGRIWCISESASLSAQYARFTRSRPSSVPSAWLRGRESR